MSHRMKFGVFLAPFHKPGINPTLALEQDLELVQWLDRCGYDEAWCGEHHSAGTEISASPEIFMAVASQRTKHIKLGSGVTSVSYHNPLWVAERIVQLGGEPDFSPDKLSQRSHAEYVAGDSLVQMIRENLVAERIAIDSYRDMIRYLGDQDPTTSNLLKQILAVEEEHADELADLLDGMPAHPA